MRVVTGRARGLKKVGKNTDPKPEVKFSPDLKEFQFSILYWKLFPRPKTEKTAIMLNYAIILGYRRPLN